MGSKRSVMAAAVKGTPTCRCTRATGTWISKGAGTSPSILSTPSATLRPGRALTQQLTEAVDGGGDGTGIAATLEAGRGLGAQSQPLRGAGDRHRGEIGRLEQHLGGRLRDLRRGASHDAGDADRRSLGVADQAVLAGVAHTSTGLPHDTGHAVEGLDRLTGSSLPDDQATAREVRHVVGVGGLPPFEHDVVRRVDDVVDGPHAGQGETPGQPRRRGSAPRRR